MRIIYIARVTFLIFVIVPTFTIWQMLPGLQMRVVQFRRLGWILDHAEIWYWGWWLWMIAISAWMVLLATLMWAYLPGFRLQRTIQSALLILSTSCFIFCGVLWQSTLPVIASQQNASALLEVVDGAVLGLLGAGALMGGINTAWMAYDLWQQRLFSALWCIQLSLAGLALALSPVLLPDAYHLLLALILWLSWCGFLSSRREAPQSLFGVGS